MPPATTTAVNDAITRKQHPYGTRQESSSASSVPPPVQVQNDKKKYFHLFPYLHEELKLSILRFVADAPLEHYYHFDKKCQQQQQQQQQHQSSLTHNLNFVNRQFKDWCDTSDVFWKDALLRVTEQEPDLWKDGFRMLANSNNNWTTSTKERNEKEEESIEDLVTRIAAQQTASMLGQTTTRPSSLFKTIYERVVNEHLRFKGPVLYMPGQVVLGKTYALHLFEHRYRLMISDLMRQPKDDAHDDDVAGRQQQQKPVYFLHANRAPLAPTIPAVLVQVVQCQIFPDGRADVLLLPVHYVWIERVWVRPDSGHLHYAQALKMGQKITTQMNRLQRQEALASVMNQLRRHLEEAEAAEAAEAPAVIG